MKVIVIVMGMINIITGAAGILVGLALAAGGAMLIAGAGSAVVGIASAGYGAALFLISAIWIVVGAGLLNLRVWARNLMILAIIFISPFAILSAFKNIASAALLLLGALYLCCLLHPKIKGLFK